MNHPSQLGLRSAGKIARAFTRELMEQRKDLVEGRWSRLFNRRRIGRLDAKISASLEICERIITAQLATSATDDPPETSR